MREPLDYLRSLLSAVIVMSKPFHPNPTEFERCVSQLCLKIETIAIRSNVSHVGCSNLERLLAEIPLRARDDVLAMLNDVSLYIEYRDPAMAFAARYMTRLAEDIWRANPYSE